MFLIFFTIQLLVLISGLAWVYIEPNQFSYWMLVFVAFLAIASGIVSTYSFVQYTQERRFKSFVIALLGANIVLLAFLYLLTHPVTTWSVFSSRERNMTIAAAIGFLITPGVLGGSLIGDRPVTRRSRNISLLWGVVIQPSIALLLLFSPEPMFLLTGEGFGGLTLFGWMLTITIGVSTSISLVRYSQEWVRTRERIKLASSLALVLWIMSFLIYLAIESPLQVAELLWFSGVANGFVLLAAAMMIASIVEPHRALESVVRERTLQLEESRNETEFYLRLWTHKIGNLLQGISTYLELIGYKAGEIDSITEMQKPAMDLAKESVLVNRQVENLVRIKENESSVTWPVNLYQVLINSIDEVKVFLDDKSISVKLIDVNQSLQVVADDLIRIVLTNLVIRCARQNKLNHQRATIQIKENQNNVQVLFGPCPLLSNSEIKEWSRNKPTLKSSVVDLDLYMAWCLMERYGGSIEQQQSPNYKEEELVLTFIKAS